MDSGPPEPLLGRFRVTGCRTGGRVQVLDAVDTAVLPRVGDGRGQAEALGSASVRLVSLPVSVAADSRVDDLRPGLRLDQLLERHGRYAIGCEGVLRPVVAGFTANQACGAEGAEPGARLIVAYATPAVTLDDELQSGAVSPRRVAEVVRAVSVVLRRLHDRGVSHGCLRPELIGVESGMAWLGGFGVAPLADAVDGARLVADAVPKGYQAPEQQGPSPAQPQPWTDTYAFGAMASALLAGTDPSECPLPTPRSLGAVVSDRVEELIGAALSRSPAGRPGDLTAWAEELADVLASSADHSVPGLQVAGSEQAHSSTVDGAPGIARHPATSESSSPVQSSAPPEPAAPSARQHVVEPIRVVPAPHAAPSTGLRVLVGILLVGGLLGLGATVVAGFLVAMRTPSPPPSTAAGGAGPISPAPAAQVAPSPADAGTTADASPLDDSETSDDVELDAAREDAASSDAFGAAHHAFSVRDTHAGIPVDGQSPIWGNGGAAVTIVVFGDLECEHTRRAHAVMTELRSEYPSQLRVVWRNRPLETHRRAIDAAVVAVLLSQELGHEAFFRFWRAAGRDPEAAVDIEAWASEAGALPGRVQSWLRRSTQPPALARDLEIAGRFNVRATPTFFVNGARIEGYQPAEVFAPMVERELEASRAALARGVPAEDLYRVRVNRNLINVGPED